MGRLTGIAQQFKHLSYSSNESCETSIRHSELALRALTDGDEDALVFDGTLAREGSMDMIEAYASPGSQRRIENSRLFPSTRALSGQDGKEQFDDARPTTGLCRSIAARQKKRRQARKERPAAVAGSILRARRRMLSHRAKKTREYNPLTASNLAALSKDHPDQDVPVSRKTGVSRALVSFSDDDSWDPQAASDEDDEEEGSSVDSASTSASVAAIAIASTVSQAIRVGADTALHLVKKPVDVIRNYRSKSVDTEDTTVSSLASPASNSGRKGAKKGRGFFGRRHSSLVVKFLHEEMDLSKFFSSELNSNDDSQPDVAEMNTSDENAHDSSESELHDCDEAAPVHVPRSRPSLSYSRSARPNSLLLQTRQVEFLNLKRFVIVEDDEQSDEEDELLPRGDSCTTDGEIAMDLQVEIGGWGSPLPPPPPSSPLSPIPHPQNCRDDTPIFSVSQGRKVFTSSALKEIGEVSDEERSIGNSESESGRDEVSEACGDTGNLSVEIEYDGVTGNVSLVDSRAFLAEQLEILARKPSYVFLATRRASDISGVGTDGGCIAAKGSEDAEEWKYDEQQTAPTANEGGDTSKEIENDVSDPSDKVAETKPQRRRSRRRSSQKGSRTMVMKFPSEALGSVVEERDEDEHDEDVEKEEVFCLVLERNVEAGNEASALEDVSNDERMEGDDFSTLVLKVSNIKKFVKLLKKTKKEHADGGHDL